MIKIADKEIPSNIIMASMSGCTDLAFRTMARRYGTKLCFFEMLDAMPLIIKNARVLRMLKTNSKDRPIAAQLLGGDPLKMLDAAYVLLDAVPDIAFLDINSACPVQKILKRKAGGYLMRSPDALIKTARILSDKLRLPVTVKIRAGFDKIDPAFLAGLARRLEDNGISAIFMHGRTCKQMYSGKVDYASIREVKNAVSIPVFGSGDIFSPELAKKMIDETGCDGITVARGALGAPWIFKDIEDCLEIKKFTEHKNIFSKRKRAMKEHIEYIIKYRKDKIERNFGFMKKIAMWYIKGFPDATTLRNNVYKTKNYHEFMDLVKTI
ncbi:hypothetical protein AUJ67_01935 [Candidatus Desantisbacteria bacterium CG1_02_49_89]|nr:MAG: hypothetical protein AUJ67_01935 [Candidatus Desantisbacteria bacterium CG1_02_49_89]